ncbi:MAG: AraC family transcriptional regulator [Spirochaetales bacterium]|nr:AraC family transcriptional regulator [Spirochaetales bacterium]
MPVDRRRIIENYMADPTFSQYYFRKPDFQNQNQLLDLSWEGKDYCFSVERLTVRNFDERAYRKFRERRVFRNHSYRLVLFLQGHNSVYVEGERVNCDETTLFLLSPGPQISVTPKSPSRCTILEFYFDLISDNEEYLQIPFADYLFRLTGVETERDRDIFGITKRVNRELRLKFETLLQQLRASDRPAGLAGEGRGPGDYGSIGMFQSHRLILDIFSLLLENVLNRRLTAPVKSDPLEPVVRAMTENYAKPYTVSDLAEIACLSPHYFQTLFKKRYSFTPGDFLNRIRIEQAMLLLENSRLSCKEISAYVGIPDGAYFSKVFKKYVGIPPLEYRKNSLPPPSGA